MINESALLQPATILVVDDIPNLLQLLFNRLKQAGYKTLIATNGTKAVNTAEAMQPDLILLDVMMPGMDGFATCERLKANPRTQNIPVIFMTALTQTEEKVRGFALGAVDYITKPIEEQELLARITTHLSIQNLNQRLIQEAARQKLLWQISDRVSRSLDLDFILETTVRDLRAFLDCDFVGLVCLQGGEAAVTAYDLSEDLAIESQSILNDLKFDRALKESQFYLQGNIRVEDDSESLLQAIAPILIDCTDILSLDSRSARSVITEAANNTLWGWLVVSQHQGSRKWQSAEISLIQELATNLAIGIKQERLYEHLTELTLLDPLTHAYNRRYFDRRLNSEWLRLKRDPSPLSLIMCDVDYFKAYNDTYGHQQGDKCLQQISTAIAAVLKRPADILARYGGEEFAVILPHTPEFGAVQVAEAIRTAVRELNIPHLNSAIDSVVTLSLGVATTVPNFEDSTRLLIEASDVALYQAKEYGRNCVAVYSEPISSSQECQKSKSRWIERIRQAIEADRFSLYAQSITPLKICDRKKHFEILLRLTDEENKVVLPDAFLGIAERNCLMVDIDRWVIDRLFAQLTAEGDCFDWSDYRFSVNLSGASLNSESFLEFLAQKLTDSQLPPQLFCFEITETIAISNLPRVVKFINVLKDLGCSFALDDFGKGMSSLTYLQDLPVDYLKIDGSFIRELNNAKKPTKFMVEAINQIAIGIGLKTVAEFVEDRAILDTVRELKVDYAQGFYLDRPEILTDALGCQKSGAYPSRDYR